jgi:hypothetical protein
MSTGFRLPGAQDTERRKNKMRQMMSSELSSRVCALRKIFHPEGLDLRGL